MSKKIETHTKNGHFILTPCGGHPNRSKSRGLEHKDTVAFNYCFHFGGDEDLMISDVVDKALEHFPEKDYMVFTYGITSPSFPYNIENIFYAKEGVTEVYGRDSEGRKYIGGTKPGVAKQKDCKFILKQKTCMAVVALTPKGLKNLESNPNFTKEFTPSSDVLLYVKPEEGFKKGKWVFIETEEASKMIPDSDKLNNWSETYIN